MLGVIYTQTVKAHVYTMMIEHYYTYLIHIIYSLLEWMPKGVA